MGWLTRFLTAVAFLGIGITFSPETFGSKSDGQDLNKLTPFLKLAHLLSFSTAFGAALWVTFIGGIIMFKYALFHSSIENFLFPFYSVFASGCLENAETSCTLGQDIPNDSTRLMLVLDSIRFYSLNFRD